MGKDPQTRMPAGVSDSVSNAETVMQELAAGKLGASSPAVAQAKEQLLADLRGHSAPKQAQAVEHLSSLYDRLPSRRERWDLAGQVVSSGPAGVAILDRGVKDDVPLDLKRIAGLPLNEQLGAVVGFLASLLPAFPRDGSPPPPAGSGQPGLPPVILETGRRKEGGASDPPLNLQDLLADDTQPGEVRLDAALRLRALAVPILVEMAESSDVSREIAAQALRALSATEARPAVGHALEHMAQRDRTFVEYVRAQIKEAGGGAGNHRAAWARASQHATMPDTWLRAAVERCDSRGILQAGAGREVVAIPMVLRRCGELSARRGGSE